MKCKFCQEEFIPNRIDQIFCSQECRNAFNNHTYKKKVAPYKNIVDQLQYQDELLDLIYSNERVTIIKAEDLAEAGIDFKNARQIIQNENGHILKAVFGIYALDQYKNNKNIYQIVKI